MSVEILGNDISITRGDTLLITLEIKDQSGIKEVKKVAKGSKAQGSTKESYYVCPGFCI